MCTPARVAKLVYAQDLKFCCRKAVWVRFPPRALKIEMKYELLYGSKAPIAHRSLSEVGRALSGGIER